MKGEEWTAAEEALLRAYVEQGLDDAEITTRFKNEGIARTYKAIQRMRQRKGWHARVNPSPVARLDQPLTLFGDALLLFDIHAPYHDAGWINTVIDLALSWGIKQVGIGGDVIDLNAFSKYGRRLGVEADDEIRATEQIVTTLARTFERIVYCGGNHEVRLARVTDQKLALDRIMRLWVSAKNVEISDYHWFQLETDGGRYYIEHPKNASIHATVVPKKLCSRFHCHVIAGHGHLWGMTRDDSGKYWAIDSGICADPQRLDYYALEHNARPAMMQGAVIVKGGTPVALSPANIGFYGGVQIAA